MPLKSDLLVLDTNNQTDNNQYDVIFWNSYINSEANGTFSLPKLVEEDAESLKAEYLKLIYELGEAKNNGKSIIDYLEIRKGFSYWWMTLLTEKCNFAKSPQIDNIIKLMALEQWLQENKYHKLKIVTSNKALAGAAALLTKKISIDFE